MYQKSLIILKPGLKIHAIKMKMAEKSNLRKHYVDLIEKDFYVYIEQYMTEGPSIFLVLGGLESIKKIRNLIGVTEPALAAPGTIRGDYAHQARGNLDDKPIRNLVHASSSLEDAKREINIWFLDSEILDFSQIGDQILSFY